MQKDVFIGNVDSQKFTSWLAEIIKESTQLNFRYAEGIYQTLEEARNLYAWPAKRTDIPTPLGPKSITKGASLSENSDLLAMLSTGLQKSIVDGSDSEIADWVQAILVWGGVYTKTKTGKGNAGWLAEYRLRGGLGDHLRQTFSMLKKVQDDQVGETINNLRSNAGLTKIYALGCDNFVIYDSRVAAALSWLISKCIGSAEAVPEHLRFATMRANTSKKDGKQRTASEAVFPYFAASGHVSAHVKHLKWNIRANWLLEEATHKSEKTDDNDLIITIRDLEASLFVIGDNLQYAYKF